jgi:hypothetical protein
MNAENQGIASLPAPTDNTASSPTQTTGMISPILNGTSLNINLGLQDCGVNSAIFDRRQRRIIDMFPPISSCAMAKLHPSFCETFAASTSPFFKG